MCNKNDFNYIRQASVLIAKCFVHETTWLSTGLVKLWFQSYDIKDEPQILTYLNDCFLRQHAFSLAKKI
jgi:hypothetical protein